MSRSRKPFPPPPAEPALERPPAPADQDEYDESCPNPPLAERQSRYSSYPARCCPDDDPAPAELLPRDPDVPPDARPELEDEAAASCFTRSRYACCLHASEQNFGARPPWVGLFQRFPHCAQLKVSVDPSHPCRATKITSATKPLHKGLI
jgi:hypothetical protein